ncbi:MAG: hypothetical protein QOI95_2236 [Acidimicrobiaceae bacterium]
MAKRRTSPLVGGQVRKALGVILLIVVVVSGCSSGDDGLPHVVTPPRCDDLLREGAVLSDAEWQAGCRRPGSSGQDNDVTPFVYPCKDGRIFYGFPTEAWGYGGERIHLLTGDIAADPQAQAEFTQCTGEQMGPPFSSGP